MCVEPSPVSGRKQVGTRARFDVFKRDAFTCQYCGSRPPDVTLHVDHIIPVSGGGGNEQSNLTTSCADCNLGKSATPLDVVPKSLKRQAEDAEERRAQVEAYAAALLEERSALDDWVWEIAEILQPGASDGYSTQKLGSIRRFVNMIGFGETRDAAFIASDRWYVGSRRFKYFCGVCWRKAKEVDE